MAVDKSKEFENLMRRKELVSSHASNPSSINSGLYVQKNREIIIDNNVTKLEKQMIDNLQLAMEKVVFSGNVNPSCDDLATTNIITVADCNTLKNTKRNYQNLLENSLVVEDKNVLSILNTSGKVLMKVENGINHAESIGMSSEFKESPKIAIRKQQENKLENLITYYGTALENNATDSEKNVLKTKITLAIADATNSACTDVAFNALTNTMNVEKKHLTKTDAEIGQDNNVAITQIQTAYQAQITNTSSNTFSNTIANIGGNVMTNMNSLLTMQNQ